MKAWHILNKERQLNYGHGEIVEAGKIYKCEFPYVYNHNTYDELTLCKAGMHGSIKPLDALTYASGPIICRVEITGKIVKGADKIVGVERKILNLFDGTDVLKKFARMCALDVVDLWDAPDIVIDYLKTGNEDLRDAVMYAVMYASSAATWDASSAATCDASRVAAMYASWDASWVAAWEKQNKRLYRLFMGEIKKGT